MENAGIFGLRKTGKTSILYSLERMARKTEALTSFVDCQTLHLKAWNKALSHVIQENCDRADVKKSSIHPPEDYEKTEIVAETFRQDIENISRTIKKTF